jgi:hypothetical protein
MKYERDPKIIEVEVIQELANARSRLGPDFRKSYFNNFPQKLPCSSHGGEGYWVWMCKQSGFWDKSPVEVWGLEQAQQSRHSKLFINSTGGQVKNMIDESIEESGVSTLHIRKLCDELDLIWNSKNHYFRSLETMQYQYAIIEAATPAYVLLLAKGFNRYPDLVG